MGKILNSTAPTVFKTVSDLDTTLEAVDRLYVNNINFGLAPQVSTANLIRRYGLYGGANFEKVSPIDLRDQTIVIKYTDNDGNTQQLFAGICIKPSDNPHGDQIFPNDNSTVATGDSLYTVYSPDYMLDLVPVDETYYDLIVPVPSAVSFNGNTPDGELVGNRATDKTGPGLTWFFQPLNGSLWRQSDIIEYLIHRLGANSLIAEWTIVYAPNVLEAMQNTVFSYNPKNKTVRQCLNELISSDRGLSWYCTWPDITAPPRIHIISISDTAVSAAGSELLPANTDTIDLSSDIKSGQGLGPVAIDTVQESIYSQVEVYGENIRVMSTLKFSADQLANNWYVNDQTDYNAASDSERALDKYEPVYQFFNLNENWNYRDYLDTFLYPDWDNTNALITDWKDPGTKSFVNWRFDRSIPLELQNQPASAARKQYRKPFVAILDDSKYYLSDKRLDKLKIGMRTADVFPGIMLKSPYNHTTAIVDFGLSNSSFNPVYEISDALSTVSFYTDQPMSIIVEGVSFKYVKKKTIYIPGLHLWVAQTGTVTDVKADGTLNTISEVTYYRDDRETLKSLAAFAAAWYGRQRNIVDITYNDFQPAKASIGQILSQVYSGGSFTVAGTIVSNVNYNFEQQTTNIKTEFPAINLPQIYTLRSRRTASQNASDISMMRSALNDIPLRDTNDSGGADAYKGYFKVIKTEASKIKIVDGKNQASAIAGKVNINYFPVSALVQEFTISQSGFIYLQCTLTGSPTATGATATIIFSSTEKESVSGDYYDLISRVDFADSSITDFNRENINKNIVMGGACS